MAAEEREFDILLWGITGWTGVHLLEHFVVTYPLDRVEEHGVTWAVVARNEEKMAKTIAQVAENFSVDWIDSIRSFQVDNMDEEAVDDAVSRARSVATVAGPYARFGEPVVKSCAKNNTHYTDITGEIHWVRAMIDKYHEDAEESGTFVVPFCGCDSIPSDISALHAVLYLNNKASGDIEAFSENTERKFTMRGYCTGMTQNNRHKGGPSGGGGTMSSVLGILDSPAKGTSKFNYLTSPDDESRADKDHEVEKGVGREMRLRDSSWTTFFPLAEGDEKVVRRSRYLLPSIYGRDLSFREKRAYGSLFAAGKQSVGLAVGFFLLTNSVTKGFVSKFLPQPSQTPNKRPLGDKYKPGSFDYVLFTEAEFRSGDRLEKYTTKTTFSVKDEVAWTVTAIMLAESCLTIVKKKEDIVAETGVTGGVLTPACLGSALIERLSASGLMEIKTEDFVVSTS